ncbi:MAG TPA: archease [Candidatus Paceibacterota bacterium]|nr:archease [Verrucomicrobiota bacterium]HRY48037.1 archease [Candidatus Paceibacterota bacterium]HSA03217.1 archease [Candidatus Paceibacterota bacterium]
MTEGPENAQSEPGWLEVFEHTADVGIQVRGDSPQELFEHAAWGMFRIVTDLESIQPREWQTVEVSGPDWSTLMVYWLSELNFLHVTRHEVYGRFEVDFPETGLLRARIGGEKIDGQRHVIHTEIKAVTYHQLEVVKAGEIWQARVLFDL